MKIPSPWPNHPHTRFNVNNGECQGTFGIGLEMELPDDAVEVLLEAVEADRKDARLVAQPVIWSKEFGILDAEDHMKKMKIKKEEEDMEERQEADRRRREAEEKAAEARRKQDEEKAAKELRKDPKDRADVTRAPSGLAKVTKPKK